MPCSRQAGTISASMSRENRDHSLWSAAIGDLSADDFRRGVPRFQGDNMAANLSLVDVVKEIAADHGATPGQVALAWLAAQGDDVAPIPGTKRVKYLEENVAAADVELTDADVVRLGSLEAAGERSANAAWVNRDTVARG